MIESISSTNENNVSLTLTLAKPEEYGIYVTSIDGLGPVKANLSLSSRPYVDGSLLTGNVVSERTITVNLTLDPDGSVEETRQMLYRAFPVKAALDFFVKTDRRKYAISGYVESFEPGIFKDKQTISIGIRCPDPYFYDSAVLEDPVTPLGAAMPRFEFPFGSDDTPILEFGVIENQSQYTHYYDGQVVSGMEIELEIRQTLVEPVYVANSTHDEVVSFFRTYGALGVLQAGDKLLIDTTPGSRNVRLTRNGREYNGFQFLYQKTANWPRMHPGENHFIQRGATIDMARTSFKAKTRYQGV